MARLTPLVDATNVTLTWERPAGRVDMYRLVWYQADSDPVSPVSSSTSSSSTTSLPDDSRRRRKRQSEPLQKRSVVVQGDSNHSYIDTLFPGTLYVVEMTSISFGVESNKTSLTLRTRKTFKTLLICDPLNLICSLFFLSFRISTAHHVRHCYRQAARDEFAYATIHAYSVVYFTV